MKRRVYLAVLAAGLMITMSACGDGAVIDTTTKENPGIAGTENEAQTRLVSVDNVEKYITLGEYKGLALSNTVDTVTDADVDIQIDENLSASAEEVSDAVQEGDLVTINYAGTCGGNTIEGGIANNYDLIVGQGYMEEGFEAGLIGMKKGETKDITLILPQDYMDENLAGQEVVYKVTLQKVRRKAEFTDEWVAANSDCSTRDEYRESVRTKLEETAKASAEEILKNAAWNTVLENSEVKEYPQEDIDNAAEEYKKQMEFYARQADMDLDTFVDSQGISQEVFEEQCSQYAQGKVKQNLIIQAIMDAEGISLDDEECLDIQEQLIVYSGAADLAELIDTYGQVWVDESIGLLRVENFIVANSSVEELVMNGDTVGVNADADVSDHQNPDEVPQVDQELENELGIEEDTDTVEVVN